MPSLSRFSVTGLECGEWAYNKWGQLQRQPSTRRIARGRMSEFGLTPGHKQWRWAGPESETSATSNVVSQKALRVVNGRGEWHWAVHRSSLKCIPPRTI